MGVGQVSIESQRMLAFGDAFRLSLAHLRRAQQEMGESMMGGERQELGDAILYLSHAPDPAFDLTRTISKMLFSQLLVREPSRNSVIEALLVSQEHVAVETGRPVIGKQHELDIGR